MTEFERITRVRESELILDIEFDPSTQRIVDIAWLDGEGEHRHIDPGPAQLQQLLSAVERAKVVIGHNLRAHDLPRLYEAAGRSAPASLEHRICDTLELSSLVFPHRPTHRLEKEYRKSLGSSDPLLDCWETYGLYQEILEESRHLPPLVASWGHHLLPQGYPRAILPEAPATLAGSDPAYTPALRKLERYLESLTPGEPGNLGALVYLHWLYHKNRPGARRPLWVEHRFPSFGWAEEEADALPTGREALAQELKRLWGERWEFRGGQYEIVEALLAGRILPVGILPTGGGKSLTFQFPALLLSEHRRALTVVISPLQALMVDQVTSLQAQLPRHASRVAYLASTLDPQEQKEVMKQVWEGEIDLLYLSPERLGHPAVQRLLQHRMPHLWVFDEAHTLSQWGHDFRPDFRRAAPRILDVYRDEQGGFRAKPLVGFVSATLTPKALADLEGVAAELSQLLDRPLGRVPGGRSFEWRGEISTVVEPLERAKRQEAVLKHLKERAGQGVSIIYVRSRKGTESLANVLKGEGIRAEHFHAKVSPEEKRRVIETFKQGELEAVVATNAFGMGIDRKGIHSVLHFGPPSTPESYIQEVGRAARAPGERGEARLFYDEADFESHFLQEAESRITYKAFRSVREAIRRRLGRDGAGWVSDVELGDILLGDDDERETKARVALFYLELAGIFRVGGRLPARLTVTLRRGVETPVGPDGERLWQHLRGVGAGFETALTLDIQDTSLLMGIGPRKLISGVRQLVASGRAAWSYKLRLRLKEKLLEELDIHHASVTGFLDLLDEYPLEGDGSYYPAALSEALKQRSGKRPVQLSYALEALRGLRVLRYRKAEFGKGTLVLPDVPQAHWRKDSARRWDKAFRQMSDVVDGLRKVYSERGWRLNQEVELDVAEVELAIEQLLARQSPGEIDVPAVLRFMQQLRLAAVSGEASGLGNLYYLSRGQKPGARVDSAYRPLEDHYRERSARIHIMRLITQQPSEGARKQLFEDYFSLELAEFARRHRLDQGSLIYPASGETVRRILDGLNEEQRRIVTDEDSRAILALAGPGSGKTRTIVHRVAYLVALRCVPPSQIVILAFNAGAAAELRRRLADLIGSRGSEVKVFTFHGLARFLTGKDEGDASEGELKAYSAQGSGSANSRKEAALSWLLDQAIEHLRSAERHPGFQYVLVDEYQDVSEQMYQIVTLLAGYEGGEDEEQRSFLLAVGDDDQNLYEWRGASVQFIRRFLDDYQVSRLAQVPLVRNYRSRPAVVGAANAFIEAALAPEERLKDTSSRIRSERADRPGHVAWVPYSSLYGASAWISDRIAELVRGGVRESEVAVITHRWDDLRFVQSALRDRHGLGFQFMADHDRLKPHNSFIGRSMLARLRGLPDGEVTDPQAHLEQLRQEAGLSGRDAAWGAICSAVVAEHMARSEMAFRIEEARLRQRSGVVLSTFHSAKGAEFDHVFVLGGAPLDSDTAQMHARKLYVGLTRAREGLWVLSDERRGHPALGVLEGLDGVERVRLEPAHPPPLIVYSTLPSLADLYLTAPAVVGAAGRRRVAAFARSWGRLGLRRTTQGRWSIEDEEGPVAIFSGNGSALLDKLCWRGRRTEVVGYTVLRVERDEEWYRRARYDGTEDHHFIVVPILEVEERTEA